MKLFVCVNQVPDTETKVKIGQDGKSIDRSEVNLILNPYDEFAVEAALQLKDKNSAEVTYVSVGGDSTKEVLRKALAMGGDKGIHIKTESTGDSYSVASMIASALKDAGADMVLFGKQSIDYDDAAVGTMVAEMLGVPSASVVVKLNVDENAKKVTCEREIEGGTETVELAMPCIISAQKGLNEPRYPSLKGIMAAKSKPVQEVAPGTVEPLTEVIEMRKPPAKQAGKILGTDKSAVPELIRLLHEEAKVI
ncbi:MAG: electron transfer flavoprotein subunit beta/FixA family protein [Bacteroidetes bacterium]|jgi:electron transfer flavoprotein beta subunit|nr:electron transfer flavoprotein subunit beta/FixA family protein [Bacteroidota bacterium]